MHSGWRPWLVALLLAGCGGGSGDEARRPASEPRPSALAALLTRVADADLSSPMLDGAPLETVRLSLADLPLERELEGGRGELRRIPFPVALTAEGNARQLRVESAAGASGASVRLLPRSRKVRFRDRSEFKGFSTSVDPAGFPWVAVRRDCEVTIREETFGVPLRVIFQAHLGFADEGRQDLAPARVALRFEGGTLLDLSQGGGSENRVRSSFDLPAREGEQALELAFADVAGTTMGSEILLHSLTFEVADGADRIVVPPELPEDTILSVLPATPPAAELLREAGAGGGAELQQSTVLVAGRAAVLAGVPWRFEVEVDGRTVARSAETPVRELGFDVEQPGPVRLKVRSLSGPWQGRVWLVQPTAAWQREVGVLRGEEGDASHPLVRHAMLGRTTRRCLLAPTGTAVAFPAEWEKGDSLELALGLADLAPRQAEKGGVLLEVELVNARGERRSLGRIPVAGGPGFRVLPPRPLPAASLGPGRVEIRTVADGVLPVATRLLLPLVAEPRILRRGGFRPPNVLVYLVDTLRADHLSCYGYPRPTSPHLDALARDGVLFERAYSQAPWTKPSVASLFSALLYSFHGTGRLAPFPADVESLAERLRGAGLYTAGFIANAFVSMKGANFEQGFGEFHAVDDRGLPARASHVNERVLPWLKAHRHLPFFLYVHTIDPHETYDPPPETAGTWQSGYGGALVPEGTFTRNLREGAELGAEDLSYVVDLYDEEILFNDGQFGALVQTLKDLELYDDTVIVFVSDHGEEFLDHGDFGHGNYLWRELLHVPLVVKLAGEGRPRGLRVAPPVSTLGITPTLAALVGSAPAEEEVQGRDLAPFWAEAHTPSQEVIAEEAHLRTLIGPDLKIIQRYSGQRYSEQGESTEELMLFDWKRDPDEQSNLAAEQAERAQGALDQLLGILERDRQRGLQRALGRQIEMTAEQRRDLQAMGYLEIER